MTKPGQILYLQCSMLVKSELQRYLNCREVQQKKQQKYTIFVKHQILWNDLLGHSFIQFILFYFLRSTQGCYDINSHPHLSQWRQKNLYRIRINPKLVCPDTCSLPLVINHTLWPITSKSPIFSIVYFIVQLQK